MYYNAGNGAGNLVENCVALNPRVGGVDNGAGAIFAVYRVAGDGTEGAMTRTNNHAFSGMVLGNGSGGAGDKTAAGRDGADRGAMPDEAFYAGLGWDFAAIWRMTGGYPRLRWE
ncbi:MAG: hypothetical protein LBG84_04145 [Treponema sp.]|jgi:hypothetical protein|nr:hypothetical protein [Treponema sp.]